MAVIFSALGITLLLSTVIVNALEVHEENQKRITEQIRNENPRLMLFETCQVDATKACFLYCAVGTSTDISQRLNYHWEENPQCHSVGISVEVSSKVYFPRFTIPEDWLKGDFKLKELQIDVENIFEICQNAFTGAVFESMQKLVLNNFHLHSMDAAVLQGILAEQDFKHLTITKYSSVEATSTVQLYTDSLLYVAEDEYNKVESAIDLRDTSSWSANISGVLIISLTIVGCMLSFTLGILVRRNFFNRQKFSNKRNKSRMIFVIENKESV